MIAQVLANREINRVGQLQQIDTNRHKAIQALAEKFSIRDKAAKSISYLSIIFLTVLYSIFFINDLISLVFVIAKYYTGEKTIYQVDKVNKGQQKKDNDDNILKRAEYLERRLAKAHIRVMMSVYANRKPKQHLKNQLNETNV